MIVYGGNTYMGNVAGMWDPSSGIIEGQIWGGQKLSGTNSSTIYPEIFNTNAYPVYVQVATNVQGNIQSVTVINGVTNTSSVPTNYSITNTFALEPQGTNFVNDGVYMNGSFDGGVANSYPNQTFTASGTMIQQQLAETPIAGNTYGTNVPPTGVEGTIPVQISSVTIPITVQGIRIADSYTTFATIDNSSNVPYSATYYTVTNPPQ